MEPQPGIKADPELDQPHATIYSVGENVRVVDAQGESAQCAVIACCHGNAASVGLVGIFRARNVNLYDVIYDSNEEANVPEFRIFALQEFERIDPQDPQGLCCSPEVWKDRGNTLFAQKDFPAASRCYAKALAELTGRLMVGSTVIFADAQSSAINYPTGIVALLEGTPAEAVLMLSSGDEVTTSEAQLVLLPDSHQPRQLTLAIYKNLARCNSKLTRHGWALRYVNLAVAVSRLLVEEAPANARTAANKALVDVLILRGKMLVALGKTAHAAQDAEELQGLDRKRAQELKDQVSSAFTPLLVLRSPCLQIHACKTKRMVSNRKLAKEVAKWVDTAMSSLGTPDKDSGDGDLPWDADQDDEEQLHGKSR